MRPATTMLRVLAAAAAVLGLAQADVTQPPSPVDPNPINGETYYLINQLSGLQVDLNGTSTASGDNILQNTRSFSNLSQRWAISKAADGNWLISSTVNGLCLDSASSQGVTWTVQNPCGIGILTQEWSFSRTLPTGYYTILNAGTNMVLDVSNSSPNPGARLIQSPLFGSPAQSQLWLFRATYFRGNDSSLLEKAESDRVLQNNNRSIWWHDAYNPGQDLLQIFKNHGMNLIRVRPASIASTLVPLGPYSNYTLSATQQILPATCTGGGCEAQTDWSALDLAKRAKQLGMSVNLTLFYSGNNTAEVPGLWGGKTVAQVAPLMYAYVKQLIELYRVNGAMPDMVAFGNEVNTGMFSKAENSGKSKISDASNCTPTSTSGWNCFATLQKQAIQGVKDAAADTTIGPPVPAPLTCIHIDGGPDLTTFFSAATQTYGIPIDSICQSYYPGWHGPLTQAQSSWHNSSNQHIQEANMANEANTLGLPVFTIEDGVSYSTAGSPQDQWYVPPTRAHQRQFTIDLNKVEKNMPKNLSMGMDWWAGEATPIYTSSGSQVSGVQSYWPNVNWLFDNSMVAGSALDNAAEPVMLALGGKLDPTLTYKFVNAANRRILETANMSTAPAASLRTGLDTAVTGPHQQWQILAQGADPEQNGAAYPTPIDHLGDGYFQIVNMNQTNGLNVLDTNGATTAGSPVVQNPQTAIVTAIAGTNANQEWDIMTAGNCGDIPANCTNPPLTATGNFYMIVNKATGNVLAASGTGAAAVIQQQAPAAPSNGDWMVPANKGQLWQIFPTHITATPTVVSSLSTTTSGLSYSRVTQTYNGTVTIKNNGGATISGPFQIVFSSLASGVTLLNATDTFKGSPFLTVPAVVSLAPGQSATVSVQFSDPSSAKISFTPITYVGSI